jgi:hypothetical protein
MRHPPQQGPDLTPNGTVKNRLANSPNWFRKAASAAEQEQAALSFASQKLCDSLFFAG